MHEQQQDTPADLAEALEAAPRYGFRAGGHRLLADAQVSVQIVDLPRLCPFPNAPPSFRGVANLRGELVPVFDIGLLGDRPPAEHGKLAVCGDGAARAALVIDDMPTRIPADELLAGGTGGGGGLPPALAAALRGVARHDGEAWLELDFHRLFEALSAPAGSDDAHACVEQRAPRAAS